mmetsp:Transcript_15343/g.33374  ORF Transcript_15343/g.33374 Transcript_15343/m.33374 type:complete len:238 (-) Transcript_15343:331-1044(-)
MQCPGKSSFARTSGGPTIIITKRCYLLHERIPAAALRRAQLPHLLRRLPRIRLPAEPSVPSRKSLPPPPPRPPGNAPQAPGAFFPQPAAPLEQRVGLASLVLVEDVIDPIAALARRVEAEPLGGVDAEAVGVHINAAAHCRGTASTAIAGVVRAGRVGLIHASGMKGQIAVGSIVGISPARHVGHDIGTSLARSRTERNNFTTGAGPVAQPHPFAERFIVSGVRAEAVVAARVAASG